MTTEYFAVAFTILFTIATSVLVGRYMFRVFTGKRTILDPIFGPIERLILRVLGVKEEEQQDWKRYALSMMISNVFMWLATFAVVSLQAHLPLNPDGIANMEPTLSFNSISSFTTNTNLQHYSGETGLSYLSQMLFVTFLQFVTAATGVAACIAIIRGLAGNRLSQIGNFYVDVTRATIRVFLPLSLLVGAILISQGTPITFQGAAKATTLEGGEQTIARGVVAPVVAIKQLGTNGGGYFGPNSAHPYENPTPFSNFIETWCITVIPMAMVWTLGMMVGRRKLAVVIFVTMLAVYIPMVIFAVNQEAGGNPAIAKMGVDQSTGSMEGKEVRFGAGLSATVGGHHHGHIERVGQLHARFDDTAWRPDADDRHVAEQHLWRSGRGLHQHADFRHCCGFRGGNHDRPNAGVSGQESRTQRDEAGEHRAAGASLIHSRRHGHCLLCMGAYS